MSKITWKPATIMAPVPVVLVGCGTVKHPNVLTVAWTGIVNSNPAMTYVSIRPQRFSHSIIKETGEFTINFATRELCRKVDLCGVYSGAKIDKFESFELKAEAGSQVAAPLIKESPVSLECKVKKVIPLGTHDMFLAEIVAVDVEETMIDEAGKLCLNRAKLIAYSHGDYLELGKKIGSFGYSVKKKVLKP